MGSSGHGGGAGAIAFGVLATALGAVLLAVAGRPLLWGLASRGWPTAEGRVVSAEIGGGGKLPALRMTYVYRVGGRELTGTKYRISQLGRGASVVPGTRTDWRPGAPVAVRYDPASPERSTVETGVHPWASIGEVLLTIFGISSILAGVGELVALLGGMR
jgi:hypothetical protein